MKISILTIAFAALVAVVTDRNINNTHPMEKPSTKVNVWDTYVKKAEASCTLTSSVP